MNYYNEFDKKAAAWLRVLISEGHIAPGEVDERSISDVRPDELVRYTQCHFFAGIGGWPLALRLAGWPDDREVWTGSCPCPPFSCAGKKQSCPKCQGKNPVPCPRRTGFFICCDCLHAWFADDRHLWPEFWRLISHRRPPVVIGEQVASEDGRVWLSGVRASMEILDYAFGSADLCAAGAGEEGEGWIVRGDSVAIERIIIGAPHIRQRLYWLAKGLGQQAYPSPAIGLHPESGSRGSTRRVADHPGERRERGQDPTGQDGRALIEVGGTAGWLDESNRAGRDEGQPASETARHGGATEPASGFGRMGSPIQSGLEGHPGNGNGGSEPGRLETDASGPVAETGAVGGVEHPAGSRLKPTGEGAEGEARDEARMRGLERRRSGGAWSSFDLVPCRDRKTRRVESKVQSVVDGLPGDLDEGWRQSDGSVFPLAKEVKNRVPLLKGAGNAIVPQLAVEFIQAYLETQCQKPR